jgi:hypothetical protein
VGSWGRGVVGSWGRGENKNFTIKNKILFGKKKKSPQSFQS